MKPAAHHRHQTVLVDLHNGPDDQGRFPVLVNGGMEQWTLDRIKQAIADGDDVRERER